MIKKGSRVMVIDETELHGMKGTVVKRQAGVPYPFYVELDPDQLDEEEIQLYYNEHYAGPYDKTQLQELV